MRTLIAEQKVQFGPRREIRFKCIDGTPRPDEAIQLQFDHPRGFPDRSPVTRLLNVRIQSVAPSGYILGQTF